MINTSNSSTNDIVNSEMITVNNVTVPTIQEQYSSINSYSIVNSEMITINSVTWPLIEDKLSPSISTNDIVNSETISVNNVIKADNATEILVTFVG